MATCSVVGKSQSLCCFGCHGCIEPGWTPLLSGLPDVAGKQQRAVKTLELCTAATWWTRSIRWRLFYKNAASLLTEKGRLIQASVHSLKALTSAWPGVWRPPRKVYAFCLLKKDLLPYKSCSDARNMGDIVSFSLSLHWAALLAAVGSVRDAFTRLWHHGQRGQTRKALTPWKPDPTEAHSSSYPPPPTTALRKARRGVHSSCWKSNEC